MPLLLVARGKLSDLTLGAVGPASLTIQVQGGGRYRMADTSAAWTMNRFGADPT